MSSDVEMEDTVPSISNNEEEEEDDVNDENEYVLPPGTVLSDEPPPRKVIIIKRSSSLASHTSHNSPSNASCYHLYQSLSFHRANGSTKSVS